MAWKRSHIFHGIKGKVISKQALLQRKPGTKANTALCGHNIEVNKSIFMFWYTQN